ncbi:hypothetical protein WR25_00660 [Diploscapter pachys]|uniref:SSD domain-containing protein n=1 Tax=Diploscapter pachys TaxID=2018661 RepID=A0A2A2JJ99_9BILA|nr:hypothetical protein WR25_00660 [Diploscapter pachys]
MSNDISDFTPFGARSRQELQIFTEFFSNKGTPKTVYAFITSKNGKSLLDVKHLNATVQSGMLVSSSYDNSSGEASHMDLGYPLTTVLGTRLFMDPNFFGVRVEVEDREAHNGRRLVNVSDLRANQLEEIVLAVMACVCPFMACGASLGGMFFLGFRFGSILAVTPFLILAIGVDDAYLMVNAYQHITAIRKKKLLKSTLNEELRYRITYMLVETGPSVSITTITNILAFGIGATTPTAEIQLFSIGNAIAVTVDFIFQLTIYAALMVVLGRWELEREFQYRNQSNWIISEKVTMRDDRTKDKKEPFMNRLMKSYCKLLSSKLVSSIVMGLLAVYWYFSIMGTLRIKAELRPERLFLKDSPIIQISSFEALPQNNGRFSTKFWLRDYETFLEQIEEAEGNMEDEDPTLNSSRSSKHSRNELYEFLHWPEFSFWNAFVQYNKSSEGEGHLTKFIATTAFHGSNLNDWSNRANLLGEWRKVVDQFPHLNASIYLEDAKFLDLISTMIPISAQSALFTFLSMFAVALLFISNPPVLFVATFSILSTSVGVFGMMSWWGADLDPIFMSAIIMSIGFSVDIPSHISYHYYQTGKETNNVVERLEKTVQCVGFPIMQASISTVLCVLSLFFVDLHMSRIFAQCMLLVVGIGTIHGMIIMPVIFSLIHFAHSSWKSPNSAISS